MVDLAFGLALGLGLGLGLVWFILTLEHSVQAAALLNVNEGGAAVPRGDAKVAIQIDEVEPALATQRQRQAQPGPDLQDRLVDGTVQALHGAVLGHHRLVGHASVDLATSSGAEVHHVFEAVVGHVEDLLLPLAVACRLLRIRGGGALARVDEVPSAVRHLRVVAHVLPARREFLHLEVRVEVRVKPTPRPKPKPNRTNNTFSSRIASSCAAKSRRSASSALRCLRRRPSKRPNNPMFSPAVSGAVRRS
mmetsp:Transcript_42879/g.134560  ORF Transcript_42879/g.134560 Transcript_42879/m.134560 type:complete len:249 (+) Transcript_42879:771-1517(+)